MVSSGRLKQGGRVAYTAAAAARYFWRLRREIEKREKLMASFFHSCAPVKLGA
jgi:hypothetical protein